MWSAERPIIPSSPSAAGLLLVALLLLFNVPVFGTSPDPYAIFTRHYQVVGGLERLEKVQTGYSTGTRRYDGLRGAFRHWEQRPLSYRTESDFVVLQQIEGDSGEVSWFFDTNGQALVFRDSDTLERRQLSLFLDRYEHLRRDSRIFTLRWLQMSTVDNRLCHEILMSNSINRDTSRFFFDQDSFLLVQAIHTTPDMETIIRPGDFREVDGILVAHYEHYLYLPWQKEEEVWIDRYIPNAAIDRSIFATPQSRQDYRIADDERSAVVDFQLIENLIYLPVRLGDDTCSWVLDSGASMSLIDYQYAQESGLPIEGNIRGYGFGQLFDLFFAKLPGLQVGDISFGPQTVYASHGLRSQSYEPEICGILGYDFLSRFIVELDYDQRRATFHQPDSFRYDGPGVSIDAPLKYRTFTLPIRLDEKYVSKWSVDLGSYHTTAYYPFAEQSGLLNRKGVAGISQGLASISHEKTAVLDCLEIAGFALDAPLISIPAEKGQGATALAEVGGNIGNSTLRNFHLFLDYPRQRIILEPGDHFNEQQPMDGSGMVLGMGEDNAPIISFIAPDSPAEKAGLLAGDGIVSLDGQRSGPGGLVLPLRHLLRNRSGTDLPVVVKRDNVEIETVLQLADLYPRADKRCMSGRSP